MPGSRTFDPGNVVWDEWKEIGVDIVVCLVQDWEGNARANVDLLSKYRNSLVPYIYFPILDFHTPPPNTYGSFSALLTRLHTGSFPSRGRFEITNKEKARIRIETGELITSGDVLPAPPTMMATAHESDRDTSTGGSAVTEWLRSVSPLSPETRLVRVAAVAVPHLSSPHEPGYPPANLVESDAMMTVAESVASSAPSSAASSLPPSSKGWRSQRFCAYPVHIVFRFESNEPVLLRRIQVLAHHSIVPSRIEFWIADDGDSLGKATGVSKGTDAGDAALAGMIGQPVSSQLRSVGNGAVSPEQSMSQRSEIDWVLVNPTSKPPLPVTTSRSTSPSVSSTTLPTFRPLGHVILADPSSRSFRARELKTVRVEPPKKAKWCKVVVGGCWVSGGNLWGQASLLSISFLASPPAPPPALDPFDSPSPSPTQEVQAVPALPQGLPPHITARLTELANTPPLYASQHTSVYASESSEGIGAGVTAVAGPEDWDLVLAQWATEVSRRKAEAVADENYPLAAILAPLLLHIAETNRQIIKVRGEKLRAAGREDFAKAEQLKREEETLRNALWERLGEVLEEGVVEGRRGATKSNRASPVPANNPLPATPLPLPLPEPSTSLPFPRTAPPLSTANLESMPPNGDPDDRPIRPAEGYSGWTPTGSDMALSSPVVARKDSPAKTKRMVPPPVKSKRPQKGADKRRDEEGELERESVNDVEETLNLPESPRRSPTRGSPNRPPAGAVKPASSSSPFDSGPPDNPDPLPSDVAPDVRSAVEVLGEEVVAACLTKRTAAVAEWGLERIATVVGGRGGQTAVVNKGIKGKDGAMNGESDSTNSQLLNAVAIVARACVPDSRERVAHRAVVALRMVVECVGGGPLSPSPTFAVPRDTASVLVDKIEHAAAGGRGSSRVGGECEVLLGEMASHGLAKEVTAAVTRPVPTAKGRPAHPKVAAGRARCAGGVAVAAGTYISSGHGGVTDGISMSALYNFAVALMRHPAGEVRDAGVAALANGVRACKTGKVAAAEKVIGWMERDGIRGKAIETVKEAGGISRKTEAKDSSSPPNPAARRTEQLQSLLQEQRELRDRIAGGKHAVDETLFESAKSPPMRRRDERQSGKKSAVVSEDEDGPRLSRKGGKSTVREMNESATDGEAARGQSRQRRMSRKSPQTRKEDRIYTKNEDAYVGDWNIDQ
ncbi:hypothetical protein HDU93_008593 [Gonapodya sp. JEL0774]|nr:hypothetical protein HDU93_008593 [Gonapodya sp. JEL0774]